jgi:hypothetical protein
MVLERHPVCVTSLVRLRYDKKQPVFGVDFFGEKLGPTASLLS